jgi:hypothetical protein
MRTWTLIFLKSQNSKKSNRHAPMNLNFYYAFDKISNVMHAWTLTFLKVPKPKKIRQACPHEFFWVHIQKPK